MQSNEELLVLIESVKSFKSKVNKKGLSIKSFYDIEMELAILFGGDNVKKRKHGEGFVYRVEKVLTIPP